MKEQLFKRIFFVSKSILWSLLLYAITVIILDWNELKASLSDNKESVEVVQTITIPFTTPVKISSKGDISATQPYWIDLILKSYLTINQIAKAFPVFEGTP